VQPFIFVFSSRPVLWNLARLLTLAHAALRFIEGSSQRENFSSSPEQKMPPQRLQQAPTISKLRLDATVPLEKQECKNF
jgi:hypothetical protein